MGSAGRARCERFAPADPCARSALTRGPLRCPNTMHKAEPKARLRGTDVPRYVLLLSLAMLLSSRSPGAAPGFWEAATQADFLRGDVEQLSIDEHGRLMLGPALSRVHDAGVPFIWTMVAGPDDSVFL